MFNYDECLIPLYDEDQESDIYEDDYADEIKYAYNQILILD